MPAEDEAESTTKATVSEGEIEIRDKENQKQDLADLNRDTQNALNKLDEIFDKDDIEEKQEFIGLAQEIGHNMIGDLTGKISDEQKAMLNTFFEGLISQWANGDFLSGASGAAVTEAAQEALNNIEDPAVRQIAVGLLSAAITKVAGGNASAAASAGISTEKYNYLTHEEYEEIIKSITRYNHKALAEGEILDRHRDEEWLEEHKNDKEDYRTKDGIPVYLPVKVGVDINGQDVYLIPGPNGGKLSMGSIVNGTPDMITKLQNFDFKNLQDGQFYTVSNSIGYGTYGISLSLTVTNTGDVFKEIQITSSATIGPDILKDITKISGTVSESYGTVEYNGKPVNDSELIKQVLSGTSLVISGNVLSSNASVSGLFSINKSMAEGTEIGTTLAGVQAGFGAAQYLGKINELRF